ncbi:MAG: DUF2975 domain-containing protein [Prolixibacteraceae bacterium]|jgi:hypothetical protein|nr:DUF2975 domain-containing protein [Prolixibacteraceae bacterium]MBT6997619.1 DUF2975 domain-containing protein [Prolixibacteraceae bacterium]MBT7394926.1 DUF2975 domain-containing protein [Prolixibacteraceae bacterium]
MKKVPVSIRIIYILASIVYYLSALVCSLGVVLVFAILFGFLTDDLQLHINMPVEVNFLEVGDAFFNGQKMEIEIVEAIGKVHLIDTPSSLVRRLAIPLLIVIPVLFWLVYLFHRFMRNVSEGRIFEKRNFELLRMLGYSLMGFWLIMVVYMQILKYTLVSNFTFEQIEITNNSRWFGGVFIGALFMLVLSHIFFKGSELEEENELTI